MADATLEVLGAKMDTLADGQKQLREDIVKCLDGHEGRLRIVEADGVRRDERLKHVTGVLGFFQIIGTAIAIGASKVWG